ncbi:MAG: hypothetical protein ABEI80_08810 [Haloplanus sp.]
MHPDAVRNVALAVLAGLLAAGTLTLFARRLPTLAFSPVYVQTQVGLLFAFLGVLPVVGLSTTTARGRLVTVSAWTAGVGSILALAALEFGFAGFAVHAGVGVASGLLAYLGVSRNVLPVPLLFRGVGVVASVLFSFGVIYVGVLIWRTTSANYVVPLLIVAAAFVAIVDSLNRELAGRPSP